MLFRGKIPFHVAARLTTRFWVPHLLRFATIRHYSQLFSSIRTIRDFALLGLFAIRYSDYSLFAIRVFQTPQLSRLPLLVDTWSISVKSALCKTQ